MRTTVELAPELLRLAKSRSAERGESLKALLNRAVAAELSHGATGVRSRPRMVLPMFGDPTAPPVRLTNTTVAAHLADADATAMPDRTFGQRTSRRRR